MTEFNQDIQSNITRIVEDAMRHLNLRPDDTQYVYTLQYASGDIIEGTSGNIFDNIIGNSPITTTGNISGTTTGNIPRNTTGNVARTTTGNVARTTTGNVARTTTGNVARTTTGNVARTTTGNVARNTTGNTTENTTNEIATPRVTRNNILSRFTDRLMDTIIINETDLHPIIMNNRAYRTPCGVSNCVFSKNIGTYTCKGCLEEFSDRDKFVTHVRDCYSDDTKNECPICFNRMNVLATKYNCHKCNNNIGCIDCITKIIHKNNRFMKGDLNTIVGGIKCPFCRVKMMIPLEVPSNDNGKHSEMILHGILNLISENKKRKTIDKNELIKLIENL
jgi:hypothetical protein